MSVTNAISGMTAIGGLLLLERSNSGPADILAMLSVVVSSVNIVGGFVVSQRMLNLFRRPGDKDFSYLMLLPGVVFLLVSLTRSELISPVVTVSALLCVAAIAALSSMSTANAGCKFGMVGVFGALVATFVSMKPHNLMICLVLMAVGGTLGMARHSTLLASAAPLRVTASGACCCRTGQAASMLSLKEYQQGCYS